MKKQKTVVILGAGITGLVSAYYLSKDFNIIIIEKEKFVGGSAAGFKYKNFILDCGPHKLYTELPGIIEEIKNICPLLKIKKKNSIYLQRNYFDFPLKIQQIMLKMPSKAFKAGLDIFSKIFNKLPDDSYENFLLNRFGKTLYNLSFRDYAEKVWNSNPKELDKELAKKRVAISSIFELIKSILFKDAKNISAEYFYYPPKGTKQLIGSLVEKIRKNKGKILTSSSISEIKLNNNNIKFVKAGKRKINADYLISTIPLDDFMKLIKADKEITGAASNLKYQNLNIIYFILNKPRALKDCWIFFPEKKFIFQRVSEQKAFSFHCCPKNKTALMVETTKTVDKDLIKKTIEQLESADILKKEEIDEYFVKSYNKTYPIYAKGFLTHLSKILRNIESIDNFYTIGRQGLFNYNNMDQCWDMAMKTAEHIKNKKSKKDWQQVKKYFDKYRIVD